MLNTQAYLRALYPLEPQPIHLSDEDVAQLLDKEEKRHKAARKAAETRRKKKQEVSA